MSKGAFTRFKNEPSKHFNVDFPVHPESKAAALPEDPVRTEEIHLLRTIRNRANLFLDDICRDCAAIEKKDCDKCNVPKLKAILEGKTDD